MKVEFTPSELEAYLDEGLSPEEMAEVERALRASPRCCADSPQSTRAGMRVCIPWERSGDGTESVAPRANSSEAISSACFRQSSRTTSISTSTRSGAVVAVRTWTT